MNCEQFRLALVGDDENDRLAAERHAASCASCDELFRADRELLATVREWKEAAPPPPARLERRIAAALAGEEPSDFDAALSVVTAPPGGRRRMWGWAAVAAVVVVGTTILVRSLLPLPDGGPYERAAREADDAQRRYVVAIAALEQQAQQVLAGSADPALTSRDAAILLNYRDRLAHLDSVIAEVQAFLEEHPGHSGGHTVLLAAYREKDGLLREILELSPGETS
jgi:hypothetical protein